MNALQPTDELIEILPEDVPVTMPELPPQLVINTLQQFKAISDPIRSRILGIIQNQPATARQIADRLGASPGAIGHHLHVLEAAGLAQVVARRIMRGIVANYYTRTARIFTYELPPEVAGNTSIGLEIMTQARDELAEALVTIEEDPVRTESFPHIRLSPERAPHTCKVPVRLHHRKIQRQRLAHKAGMQRAAALAGVQGASPCSFFSVLLRQRPKEVTNEINPGG